MLSRVNQTLSLILSIFFMSVLLDGGAHAQVTTADIVGTITDSTGAVVTTATVTATNTGTGEARTAAISAGGEFQFSLLQVGTYQVGVKALGFKSYSTDVTLAAGDRARTNVTLSPGEATQTVQVQATTPALQSDSSTIGTLITSQATQDLPLNGRNITNLITLSAGVTGGLSNALNSGTRPDDRRQSSSFAANGQSDEINNNMVDGMDNNERFIGSVGVRPSIDAIEEVRVLTNLYTAEVSRTGGGVVDLITKSGTNQFHGTVYEFFRNDVLDARDFFSRTGAKPELRQNQFGGSIGGPIARDKAFFFFDYEGFRQVKGVTATSTVPTLYEEQHPGDFSDLGPNCTDLTKNAGFVPDKVGLNYFNLYPAPNNAVTPSGTGCAPPTNNFTYTSGQTIFTTTYDTKVDYRFSDKNSAFARYTYNKNNAYIPGNYPIVNGVNPGQGPYGNFSGPAVDQEQSGALGFTHVLSPSLVLDLRAQYLRLNNESSPVNSGKEVATTFGFPGSGAFAVNLAGDKVSSGLPNISFTQPYGALGDADYVPLLDQNNTFQYMGALSWLKGAHSVKFGASLIRRQVSEGQSSHPRGNAAINSLDPALEGSGNDLAVLLTGQATSVTRGYTVVSPAFRSWEEGFYAQDDWRVRPNLTLNLGIRYDIYTPFTAANNAFSNFDPATLLLVGPGLPGSQRSSATGNIKTDYGDVAPRAGFAYTVRPGMVVRGGYGITFFPGNATSGAFMKNAPYAFNFSCGDTAAPISSTASCNAPLGGTNGSWFLAGGLPVPSTNLLLATDPSTYASQGSFATTDFNFKSSYLQQYSVNVEQEYRGNVLTLAYVGNRGGRLVLNGVNLNQRPYPGADFPLVAGGVGINERKSVLTSNYNALQISLQRRLTNGLATNVNYTWSHNLTNAQVLDEGSGVGNCVGPCHVDNGLGQPATYNSFYQYDYGNADLDTRHRASLTMTYNFAYGSSFTGAKGIVAKGWSVNAIYFVQTGNPFNVSSAVNNSGLPITERPNQTGNPQGGFHRTINQYFDVTKFTLPGTDLLGNARRNSVFGPGAQALSFSLFKTLPITEKISLQLRAESFNLLNTPTFSNPNSNINYDANGVGEYTGSAGQIGSTTAGASPRQFQFAAKLQF